MAKVVVASVLFGTTTADHARHTTEIARAAREAMERLSRNPLEPGYLFNSNPLPESHAQR
jgi:hypothetical protein